MNNLNFETEVLAIQDELLRFADKLTNGHEEAERLLETTKQMAIERKEEFKPDMNFRGWIYTLMRNIFITDYYKEMRNQTFMEHTSYNMTFEGTEAAYDFEEIHKAINNLPKEYRIPYSMHVSGFKYREIADKLELPEETVKSRIEFCREKLQIALRTRIK